MSIVCNKIALITGAGRGLGRHLADAFLERGYCLAVNYLRSETEARSIVSGAAERAIAVMADVGSAAEVQKMVVQIEQAFGRLDVVINNAGITKDSLLIKQAESDWDAIIRTNLTGCFHVIRAVSPLIKRSGGGHIINISSRSGLKGSTGQAAYSASKAALIGLTLSAAMELADDGIRVNAVLPGYMLTDMAGGSRKASSKAEEESAFGRLTDPASVARSICSLAELDYITGQTISLDSRIP